MRRLLPFAVLLVLLPLSALNAATSPKPKADGSSAPAQTDAEGGRISVTAKADTTTPYQNQPVLYTVRVVVRAGISKMSASDIEITNAIVEDTGSPDVSDDFERGRPVKVAEFHYIITPLQAGKIIIPAVALEGEFQAPSLALPPDPSGNSAVSSATQQALNFFSTYGAETFHIASNATALNNRTRRRDGSVAAAHIAEDQRKNRCIPIRPCRRTRDPKNYTFGDGCGWQSTAGYRSPATVRQFQGLCRQTRDGRELR
jgi:hypothetical protein